MRIPGRTVKTVRTAPIEPLAKPDPTGRPPTGVIRIEAASVKAANPSVGIVEKEIKTRATDRAGAMVTATVSNAD